MASDKDSPDDGFDGIICIGGEDWWYHNRGHFDFQIMRRFAEDWPGHKWFGADRGSSEQCKFLRHVLFWHLIVCV